MAQEIYHRSEWGNPNEQWGNVYLNADLTNELYKRASEYENSWVTDQLLNGVGTKPSIILTPTAYEDGKLNSVKPQRTFGSELITNGDFATDSDWSKGAGWSISGGKGIVTNSTTTSIYQDVLTLSKSYKASFTISSIENGSLKIGIGVNFSQEFTEVGTYTYYGTPSNDSLLRITPSNGTNATIDNVSVKEVIDADFDFTRGSSATRVNAQGLVEDVQILSSNLVQNGDFSQEGAEQITNGDFSSDTAWVKAPTGAAISGGVAILNSLSVTYIFQDILIVGKTYKITFDATISSGSFYIGENGAAINIYTVGTYTNEVAYFTVSSSARFIIRKFGEGVLNATIDNVSVKEVGQDWTLGTGWSIGDGKAESNGSQSTISDIEQNITLNQGSTYIVKFDLIRSAGTLYPKVGNTTGTGLTSTQSVSQNIVAGSSNKLELRADANFIGSITNISVIEITSDTNLPRIDYTGGEGHWLFEPQSTNLLTYSEDFSQTVWNKGGVNISSIGISPSGSISTLLTEDTSNGEHRIYHNNISVLSGVVYTDSFYIKSNGRSKIRLSYTGFNNYEPKFDFVNNNLISSTGGTTANIKSVSFGDGWYKVSVTDTATLTNLRSVISLMKDDGSFIYVGNGTSGAYIWGAQLEQQSFATSYIPTEGSIKTRLQDAAFGAGSSDLINSTEGVLYAEIASFISTDVTEPNRYLTLTNGTSNERIALLFGGNTNQLRAIAFSNTQSINLSFTTSLTDAKQFNKLAIKYKSGDYAFFLNGIKIGGSTETNIFTANTLNDLSFDVGGGTQKFRGKVKCVAVFKEALNNDELECLTGEGYETFNALALANNYTII